MNEKAFKNSSIIFLCQFFYPEVVSTATLSTDVAIALSEKGYKVGCLCGYSREYVKSTETIPKTENYHGTDICRLKYKTLSRKSKFGRLINYFSFTFKCLRNINKIKKYDYVVVYSNPPILPYVAYKAHKKYGTKIIFVSFDVYPEIAINSKSISDGGLITKIMRGINSRLFPVAEKVVTLSNDMRDYIIKNRDIPEEKVVVIPNWFEKNEFDSPYVKSHFTVSYFGNVGVCQDIQTLLETAELLKDNADVHFVIGGHGKKIEDIKKFVLEHGLKNVEILPFLTGEKYQRVMSESDCFVVSLEKDLSGLCYPSKYYSYLAYGRPVLAIMEKNCLTDELEQEEIGYRIANGDSMELAKKICDLQTLEKKKYLHICEKAFQYFKENYTTDLCTKKYCDLFED